MTYNIDITGSAGLLNGQPASFYLNGGGGTPFESGTYTPYIALLQNQPPTVLNPIEIITAKYTKFGNGDFNWCSVTLNFLFPTISASNDLYISVPYTANFNHPLDQCVAIYDRVTGDTPGGIDFRVVNTDTSTTNLDSPTLGYTIVVRSSSNLLGNGLVGAAFIKDANYNLVNAFSFSNRWFYAHFNYITDER